LSGVHLRDARDPNNFELMQADFVTQAPKQIDNDHAYIHEGHAFGAFSVETSTATTRTYLLKTPATTADYKYVHFRPVVSTNNKGGVEVSIYEGTTQTGSTGGQLTLWNRNRNSAVTAGTTIHYGVTGSVSTALSRMAHYYAGGSTGQGVNTSGGSAEAIYEWVLKPNTKYSIVYSSPASTKIGAEFFLYEEARG
jgi:hypothetical protein